MQAISRNNVRRRFTGIEKEVIFLKAVSELIDSMVNFEVLNLLGNDPHSEVRFKTITHQKYFNIILVDFLSCSNAKVLGKKLSYLAASKVICKSPHFNRNNSIKSLSMATKKFVSWLEQKVKVGIWLPSINTKRTLPIKRIEFIRICGNISKHNFTRLSHVANELIRIFNRSGKKITFDEALLILSDFYERFHHDILNYHGSTIAEFLNNMRWGIFEYLQPEFQKSIVYDSVTHPPKYHYTYPVGVNNGFAKNCYWDLMNEVRSKPYFRRFQVNRYLKMRY